MIDKLTIEPSEHAADSSSFQIVEVERGLPGSEYIKRVVVPTFKAHALWKFYRARVEYSLYRSGEWHDNIAFVAGELTVDAMEEAGACDFSYDGIRGETRHVVTKVALIFEHSYSGKVIVTETFPKKIIVSGGKVTIDG